MFACYCLPRAEVDEAASKPAFTKGRSKAPAGSASRGCACVWVGNIWRWPTSAGVSAKLRKWGSFRHATAEGLRPLRAEPRLHPQACPAALTAPRAGRRHVPRVAVGGVTRLLSPRTLLRRQPGKSASRLRTCHSGSLRSAPPLPKHPAVRLVFTLHGACCCPRLAANNLPPCFANCGGPGGL